MQQASIAQRTRGTRRNFAAGTRRAGTLYRIWVVHNDGVAQGFALVVHELAINAAKHGALTQPSGSIYVRWSLDTSSAEPSIHFIWPERGGPPSSPPEHRGFGTLLIERAVASSDRPPRFDYGQEGLTYELTALC